MSNKLCITTYFDQKFQSVGNISLLTHRKYAHIHGADYVVSKAPISKEDRPAPWNKILIIKHLFNLGYEWVLWVDADALFVRYDVSIFESEIEKGKALFLVAHPYDDRAIPNFGVFLIKNSTFGRKLLRRIWDLRQYKNHKWWENAALIHLISKEDFSDFGIQNGRRLCEYDLNKIKYLDMMWNSIPEVYTGKACADNPIIKHYAGFPYDVREKNMKVDFLNTY